MKVKVAKVKVAKEHVQETPAMVVEILSPSTRQRDLIHKRELYREQGVPIYLMIDSENETTSVLKLQDDGQYDSVQVTDTWEVTVCDTCQLKVDFSRLFV